MPPTFAFVMQDGPTPGLRTQLQRRSLLLGRDPASDMPINDVEVSRRHARLIAQANGYAIEDLGSTNGTFVNEQRIKTAVPLRPGDVVRLGDKVTFVFEAESVAADEASTTGIPAKQLTPSTAPRASATPARPARPTAQLPALEEPAAHSMPAAQPAEYDEPEYAEPAPASRRRARRSERPGFRMPVFSQRWVMPVAIAVIFGACALTAFLWYVDANFLWCDVFGGIIPACG
jgi:predicted component of type VI protein secretion system